MAKKKPTAKEMEKVINLVIQQTEILIQRVNKLEFITETYHEYKNEKEDFIKYLNRKVEKSNKDRDGDSSRNNEQQNISKPAGSDKGAGEDTKKKSNSKKKEGKDNESI